MSLPSSKGKKLFRMGENVIKTILTYIKVYINFNDRKFISYLVANLYISKMLYLEKLNYT